ncbi:MAG TPA: ankyrin repeat domain-containing protein [Thiolinea sp.]|nr:ankyrin repeat domain-containing protein [Thiolinea sp.]
MRLLLPLAFWLLISFQAQAEQTTQSEIPQPPCQQLAPENDKFYSCWEKSFAHAFAQFDYVKINKWLEQDAIKKVVASSHSGYFLNMLFCGTEVEGGQPTPPEHRDLVIKITEQLLALGASFDSMPSYVTTLFCVVNNNDSEMLDYVLTRINAQPEDLDTCPYEGVDPLHVPIIRTIANNDLESAKVLLQHGAALNYRILDTTPLIQALQLGKLRMADWLLDMGVSVYETDDGKCSGQLPIAYAQAMPAELEGREQVIMRIESLMQVFPNTCKKKRSPT